MTGANMTRCLQRGALFDQICEKDKLVKILEITTIDKAHKLYKRFEE